MVKLLLVSSLRMKCNGIKPACRGQTMTRWSIVKWSMFILPLILCRLALADGLIMPLVKRLNQSLWAKARIFYLSYIR